MEKTPRPIVAIFGGAIAGSEAAFQLAERGIHSVVFEMGTLPYGKIELGLPKWHAKQRDKEEKSIDRKLDRPEVTYVPRIQLGKDVSLDEVVNWGFSAVLLAIGAWKDRPLSVPGIEQLQGRGFYYQNPLVAWFNQYHDPDYSGPQVNISDNALVIGGGLASLDVVKILMLETTQRALHSRSLDVDLFTLEKKGIPKTLKSFNLNWKDLELKGCTLCYRRRDIDMPLVPMSEEPTPQQLLQAKKVRKKLLETAQAKYLFRFKPCCLPTSTLVENNCLIGLEFQQTKVEAGKVKTLEDHFFRMKTPLVISSIGSLPEPIPGLSLEWDLFPVESESTGKIKGYQNVFALGNAVTGRGNIRASRLHARKVAEWIMEHYLKWEITDQDRLRDILSTSGSQKAFKRMVIEKKVVPREKIKKISKNVTSLQTRVGYTGNYSEWISQHSPIRLENLNERSV